MDASYSDIQYKGVMKYGTGYHHVAAGKNGVDKRLDWEDMLKEVSKPSPSERKAALSELKRKAKEG